MGRNRRQAKSRRAKQRWEAVTNFQLEAKRRQEMIRKRSRSFFGKGKELAEKTGISVGMVTLDEHGRCRTLVASRTASWLPSFKALLKKYPLGQHDRFIPNHPLSVMPSDGEEEDDDLASMISDVETAEDDDVSIDQDMEVEVKADDGTTGVHPGRATEADVMVLDSEMAEDPDMAFHTFSSQTMSQTIQTSPQTSLETLNLQKTPEIPSQRSRTSSQTNLETSISQTFSPQAVQETPSLEILSQTSPQACQTINPQILSHNLPQTSSPQAGNAQATKMQTSEEAQSSVEGLGGTFMDHCNIGIGRDGAGPRDEEGGGIRSADERGTSCERECGRSQHPRRLSGLDAGWQVVNRDDEKEWELVRWKVSLERDPSGARESWCNIFRRKKIESSSVEQPGLPTSCTPGLPPSVNWMRPMPTNLPQFVL